MNVAAPVALGILVVAASLLGVRAAIGPRLADRALAIDSIVSVLAGGIAVLAAWTGDSLYLDAALLVALLGFVGTVTVGRYIEERGS